MRRKLPESLIVRVIAETWDHTRKAELLLVASSLAYTSILSLVPALAVSFAIFQAFGGLQHLSESLEPFILSNLAEGAGADVLQRLHEFIGNVRVGALGVIGVVGLLFTSMSMLSSIEKAVNRVWQTRTDRTWFQRFTTYWLFMTLGPLAFAIALGFVTSNRLPLQRLVPGGTGIFGITIAAFYLLYRYVPNATVSWRSALAASLITSLAWNLTRVAFGFYAAHAMSYGKIYGSLGAIPILLLWIYIVWVVVLSGAALTAAIQKYVERLPARPLPPADGGV